NLIKKNSALEYDLGLLRKETIRHHLNPHIANQNELNLLVNEAYEFFLGERHKVVFYEEVVEVLEDLSSQFMLGVLTNGNADVNKLGIGNLFDFSIASTDVMSNKPDPAHFIRAKEITGIDFQSTLHIGDDAVNDIKGARDLGINTMWFNSQNLPWDIDDNPPIEFNHWSEFKNLLSLHHDQ
ncbi:HAD family hydrolase, partial [Gammaproteobacteria bacterium]|nr:HAD family hydrolase [Gammaproteobacteria bacterium]